MSAPLWALWWVWMAAALGLAIVEVVVPGFIFLGFAAGAAIVALGLLSGLVGTGSLPLLLLIFAGLSLVAWLVLRRVFARPEGQVKIIERDINDE